MDDEQQRVLIDRCKRGDRDAFAGLVDEFQRPVFAVAYRMLGHVEEAADVAQNVFLKVYEHLDACDPRHRVFSWVYRIAVNESLDRLRWRQRHDEDHDAAFDAVQADERLSPDACLDAEQLHERVQDALMSLDQDHRAVIVMRHYAGCSYAEMAQALQIPEKTVKSRLYSARQLLKQKLCAESEQHA